MLLQHGFLGSNFWYSALAQDLAQRTNSIVVVPNIPSFGFFTCSGCSLSAVPMQQGVAALFIDPNRTSLNASATAAGYQGVLPEDFVLTGHSAGGGLAAGAGGFYADAVTPATNALKGVVMYDGVSSNGTFAGAVASLNRLNVPLYQIAAPPQAWNANGQTTSDLVALHPDQFVGDVLANGSHVDSLIGGNPTIDFLSQLLIKPSPPGNTQAVYTLANGWINDFYVGAGPEAPQYGIYGTAGQPIIMGNASAVVLPTPLASQLGPIEKLMKKLTGLIMPLIFGGSPSSVTVTPVTPVAANPTVTSPTANGVTGVKTGNTTLTIQVGSRTYNAPADWYFPTQADGSVQADGVIWLQHGFWPRARSTPCWPDRWRSRPTASSSRPHCRPSRRCSAQPAPSTAPRCRRPSRRCSLGSGRTEHQRQPAGYQGTLPEDFAIAGHSAGGGLAMAVAGDYVGSRRPPPTTTSSAW